MGGRINTDHADLLLRDLRRPAARGGDRADQEGDREDLRQEGRGGRRSRTSPPSTQTLAQPPRGDGARPRRPRTRDAARRSSPTRRPTSSSACTAVMHRRQGRPAAGVAPSRSTAPGRPAPRSGRSATSRSRSRSGTPTICIQCNKCALVCPHAAIRAKVYDADALAKAPGHLQVRRLQGRRVQGQEVHDPGGARGLHRLRPLRRWSARPRTRRTRSTRRSTWRRMPPLRERRARRTTSSSSTCPRPTATEVKLDVKGTQFLQPLFEYSGACAGCGETPYVKLLTQLFGDRVADRQRHRLLVDLRRQPADHALHAATATAAARPGPTRSSRTTPSSASACAWPSTSTRSRRASSLQQPRRQDRRRPGRRRCSTADQTTEAGIAAQRERVVALQAEAREASQAPRRSGC